MGFPLSKDKIAWTEEALGVRFPLDYLSLLLRDNGGGIDIEDEPWFLIPFRDDTDRRRFARSCNDVVSETRKLREWSNFPPAAVAIAVDGGGNALLLLPAADEPLRLDDTIYIWMHDSDELDVAAHSMRELQHGHGD